MHRRSRAAGAVRGKSFCAPVLGRASALDEEARQDVFAWSVARVGLRGRSVFRRLCFPRVRSVFGLPTVARGAWADSRGGLGDLDPGEITQVGAVVAADCRGGRRSGGGALVVVSGLRWMRRKTA